MQTFFHHTLPLLRPVLLVAVVLRTIDAVGTFDQIFVLTKGGPGTATQLISIYAYNTAFLFNQYGRAMAMLIGVLAFLLVLMTAAVRLMRRSLGEDRVTLRERLGAAVRLSGARRGDPARALPLLVDARHLAEAAGRHLLGRGALAAADHLRQLRPSLQRITTSAISC